MGKMDNIYGKSEIGLCIEKIDNNTFCGTVHTPYHKENDIFYDVVELLLLLDKISEERGFPNTMYKKRSLVKKVVSNKNIQQSNLYRTNDQMYKSYKKPATFMLYITGRKYGSLQGHMICQSTGNKIKYQSELELVQLMEKHWKDRAKKENMEMVL
ncbi:MAG: hypothetical protein HFJ09_07800 [Lachnospiraceae bacterium]|nr:hypothetical protein [Lachnospiraceae bacterium]